MEKEVTSSEKRQLFGEDARGVDTVASFSFFSLISYQPAATGKPEAEGSPRAHSRVENKR